MEGCGVIVTDREQLALPCSPVLSRTEGGEIARKLVAELARHNRRARRPLSADKLKLLEAGQIARPQAGVGLAANQIGIRKNVCVLLFNGTPLVLMNPVISWHADWKVPFNEGCLSFPGRYVDTYRWPKVVIETLNLGPLTFGCDYHESHDLNMVMVPGREIFKAIIAQHEIAHLRGLTMYDFATPESQPNFA